MRKKRPLDRSEKVLRDASLVVIGSEDTYAVQQYFAFFRSTRIQFKALETREGKSSPEHVLARVDEYKEEYDIGDGDQFWLVLDCDHWIASGHIKNLVWVMSECRRKDIRVALSQPCFELWLLLHFDEFPTENDLSRADLERRIRKLVGSYDKTKVYKLPVDNDRVKTAVKRSKDRAPSPDEIPKKPRTGVHCIIEDLVAAGVISVESP